MLYEVRRLTERGWQPVATFESETAARDYSDELQRRWGGSYTVVPVPWRAFP